MAAPKDVPSGQCITCLHVDRQRAELLLAGGAGLRAVGRKFNIPYHSLRRHWMNHVSQDRRAQLITGPLKPMELATRAAEEGLSLLDHVAMVRSALMSRFLTAAESDDRMGTAHVGGRLIDCLRLTAQLTGDLQRATAGTTNNIAIINSPFVADLQSMLLRTLAPFPEARRAVLEGLEELSRRAVPDVPPMLGRVIDHVG